MNMNKETVQTLSVLLIEVLAAAALLSGFLSGKSMEEMMIWFLLLFVITESISGRLRKKGGQA